MSKFKIIKCASEVQYIQKETNLGMEFKFIDSRLLLQTTYLFKDYLKFMNQEFFEDSVLYVLYKHLGKQTMVTTINISVYDKQNNKTHSIKIPISTGYLKIDDFENYLKIIPMIYVDLKNRFDFEFNKSNFIVTLEVKDCILGEYKF